jgi:pimeloyl-ACP methyl ester carboxylesterase
VQQTEGFITTEDGVRLFYRKLGKGPRTVIIPNATYMFDDFKYLGDDGTVIFYDLRNRGRSDSVTDPTKLRRGVHNDVDDLEAVRRHFSAAPIDLIAHSYLGMVVILYAMKYAAHVNRIVQIGPVQPVIGKQYPPHLTGADAVMKEVFAKMTELQKAGPGTNPAEFGEKMWSVMRQLFVTDPADADKITWSTEGLPNETVFSVMSYYNQYLLPSMQSIHFSSEDLGKVQMPVLTVHGTRDRNAPYGGGKDWAESLPNARLITIENGAHLPWIDAPEKVFGSIRTFLNGSWPETDDQRPS